MSENPLSPQEIGAFVAAKNQILETKSRSKKPVLNNEVSSDQRQKEDLSMIKALRQKINELKQEDPKLVTNAGNLQGNFEKDLSQAKSKDQKDIVQQKYDSLFKLPEDLRQEGLEQPIDAVQSVAEVENLIRDRMQAKLSQELGRLPTTTELNSKVEQEFAKIGKAFLSNQKLAEKILQANGKLDSLAVLVSPYLNQIKNQKEAEIKTRGIAPAEKKAPFNSVVDFIAAAKNEILKNAFKNRTPDAKELNQWYETSTYGQLFRAFEQLAMMDNQQINNLWSVFSLSFRENLIKNPDLKSSLSISLPSIKARFYITGEIELGAPFNGGDDFFMPQARNGVNCYPDGRIILLGNNNNGARLDESTSQNVLPVIARRIKALVESKGENAQNFSHHVSDIVDLRIRGL